MRQTETLTGKIRYRTHESWCSETMPVLQVEVSLTNRFDHNGRAPDKVIWRDVKVKDLFSFK